MIDFSALTGEFWGMAATILILGAACAVLGAKFKFEKTAKAAREREIEDLKFKFENERDSNLKLARANLELEKALAISGARLEEQTRLNERQNETYNSNLKKLEAQNEERAKALSSEFGRTLELMKAQMLNLNAAQIKQSSSELVQNVLATQIKPLKEEIEKYQKENRDLNVVFRENFESLKRESANIMNEAGRLTAALKGNKKLAGNWGEMRLYSVLEASGLVEGENYARQVSYKDKSGAQKFLDATVDFGGGRKVVIDAKCSLVHYLDYSDAKDEESEKEAAKLLAADIKNHVDNLSSKDYKSYTADTYEYIFMFVPNENMLFAALTADKNLYQYAYERGIFLATPLTLLMALKTVYICWQNLKSDENVLKITEAAGKLYDKFAGFIEDFAKIEATLGTLSNHVANAKTKLNAGTGNIVKRIEDVRALGAKTSKKIAMEYDKE